MKIFCPCDNSFSVKHNSTINIDKSPEVLKEIANGSFLKFECPKCGRGVRSEIKTRFEWPSKGQTLLFVPEANRIACLNICSGNKKPDDELKIEKDETPVIGFIELAERIACIQADLDPHALEVLKFFLLDSAKDIKNKKIKIVFNAPLADGKFEFYVHGLKADEVAVMQVPDKLYDSIAADIKKKKKDEVFKAVFLGNYLSYQNIFTEGRDNN